MALAALPWVQYTENVVGLNHPTFADVDNRALRALVSQSGYTPDAVPFPGLAGPVFNAKAFGAVTDGVSDDVPGILAAITALPTAGGIVYLPLPTVRYTLGQDLVINRPNVTMLWGPGETRMGGHGVRVTQGSDNVALIGTPGWGNTGFAGAPGGTYFDYQPSGTGTAFLVGSAAGATRGFTFQDITVTVAGSGSAAIALSLIGVQVFDLVRPRMNGLTAATTQIGIRLDGTGGFCGIGRIVMPYVTNFGGTGILCTATGGANVTATTIQGGEVSGTNGGMGLSFTGSDGCFVLGTDLENCGVGLDFNSASNCWAFVRLENNSTTDVQARGGSISCTCISAKSATTFINNGGLTLNTGNKLAGPPPVTLTDAATILVDANLANLFQVTLAGNRTMGAASNPFVGQRVQFTVIQDGVGGRTLNFATNYPKFTWSDAGNTLGKRSTIAGIYDGTNWNQDGAQTPYI